MPLRDLREAGSWIERIHKRVRRLESGAWLENSSITDGIMRFIRGILRIEQGGRLELIGTLDGVGTFIWRGPWTFTGDGEITGNVDLTGNLEVLDDGRIRVGNVVLSPEGNGRITVGTGTRQIVIDATTPRITIGGGTAQIILDPSQLKVGPAFKMDPAHSSDGAQQEFGLNGRATLFGSNTLLSLLLKNAGGDVLAGASLQPNVGPIGTGPGLAVNGQIHAADIKPLPADQAANYLVLGSNGVFYKTSGTGGGGGSDPGPIAGEFMWPFSQTTTNPVIGFYGMRVNPVSGLYRLHAGQDFTVPYGSSIPAAGDGTVSAVGFDTGRGNYVIIDHGGGITTHYFHMAALSSFQVGDPVTRGIRIGAVGSTGNSTGAHLHWETHVGGTAIDPRVFMANQEG